MTWTTSELSQEDSFPVELYEFIGHTTYRLTSADHDITFNPGGGTVTYFASPITRSGTELSPDGDVPQISVTMPHDTQLAQKYLFQTPPQDLELKLWRRHHDTGDMALIWHGDVNSWSLQGKEVTLSIPDMLAGRINEPVAHLYYQPYCQNILYDTECGVSRVSDLSIFISTMSADRKTLTTPPLPVPYSTPNDAAHGELVHDATGERRTIVTHTGGILNATIVVFSPFSADVAIGAGWTISRGCDRSWNTCVTKFGNEENFTGCPFMFSQPIEDR